MSDWGWSDSVAKFRRTHHEQDVETRLTALEHKMDNLGSQPMHVSRILPAGHQRGMWNMACFNGLSPEQQKRVVEWGNLPFGYEPEGGCLNGAEVEVTTVWDKMPGPRFYCLGCAIEYLQYEESKGHEREPEWHEHAVDGPNVSGVGAAEGHRPEDRDDQEDDPADEK